MKEQLKKNLINAIQQLDQLPSDISLDEKVIVTDTTAHGDYTTNVALILAKIAHTSPRELAQKIMDHFPTTDEIQHIEIAGPGFINFYLSHEARQQIIKTILAQGDAFGKKDLGQGRRLHIEYVSANPTGPLHVGHGRGAAYGATVANLLSAVNYKVHREYYVNDAGRQMKILAASVWLRYLEQEGEAITFPENAYLGQYIKDIAAELAAQYEGRFHHTQESVERLIHHSPEQEPEKFLDDLVAAMQALLSEADYDIIFQAALNSILDDIRDDLAEFGVTYDEWFRESTLFKNKLIESGVNLLEKQGYVYEKDGAKWFSATQFGDEKDRVLIRENGAATYFASDVAYHLYKFQQGYDRVIDVFGADHHGYIARLRAFLKGLGEDPEKMRVLLVQFAILYRGKEKVSMSTRKGEFVTLRQLREEVGNDAARYFYIMRKPEQHLDFDLELAKSQSNENPVYYIQYAHARICSVWRQMESQQQHFDEKQGQSHLGLLGTDYEKDLLKTLARYPDVITKAAENYAPHLLANYLHELAAQFHSYYNAEKFLIPDAQTRNARLCLISAIQTVLQSGLTLLGVSAPDKM